jgi:hypothetical protein
MESGNSNWSLRVKNAIVWPENRPAHQGEKQKTDQRSIHRFTPPLGEVLDRWYQVESMPEWLGPIISKYRPRTRMNTC